ncbi:MAG: Trk family potassium uptake protein, partial [bacterium]|nr:Trk family potassium uptake protein [bacterium]
MAQLVGNVTSYTPRVLASWYLGLIICGGLLLLTPWARGNPEQPISPLDAIFTSTSAACVTGLAVRST